jgi:uncharacterized protein with ACT and thioredoxin-like domain
LGMAGVWKARARAVEEWEAIRDEAVAVTAVAMASSVAAVATAVVPLMERPVMEAMMAALAKVETWVWEVPAEALEGQAHQFGG